MELKKWRICINEPFDKCEYIYPIQQRKVKILLDELKKNELVKKIVIFGSSITSRCHSGSDVDIYVEFKENPRCIPIDCYVDFGYDFWDNYHVDQRLKNEIDKTGLILFEKT